MKNAVIFLEEGFEEVETLATVDVLRRGGVVVTIAGASNVVTGAHNMQVVAEKDIRDVKAADYDAFICPGGMPGTENLKNNEKVISIIKEAFAENKIIGAICAAPLILDFAGILAGKNFTMYPGMESHAPTGIYHQDKKTVVDGNIVTSKGPATVFEFAYELLVKLEGTEKADAVAKYMLFK